MVELYQRGMAVGGSVPIPGSPVLARLCRPEAAGAIALWLLLLSAGWWALHRLVPDALTLHAFGHAFTADHLHRRLIDRAAVLGLLVPAVFLAEYVWVGWDDCSMRRFLLDCTPSTRADLSCFLVALTPVTALAGVVLTLGLSVVSGESVRRTLVQFTGFSFSLAGAPLLAQTALLFLVYSLFDYWSHRLDHSRTFWPLHRFHHAADDFVVLTAARTHPAVFTAVIGTTLPGVVCCASPDALGDLAVFVMTLRLVIHSRIDSDFGLIGAWIVQSPRHHRLHHSWSQLGVNLGLMPVWDRLFGTWREPPPGPVTVGVATPYRHGAWILPDIWRDYRDFWSGLLSRPARAGRKGPQTP